MRSFYLFQRGQSFCFALSKDRYVVRRLPKNLDGGAWVYRSRVTAKALGNHYLEAQKLVEKDGYCVMNLDTRTKLTYLLAAMFASWNECAAVGLCLL